MKQLRQLVKYYNCLLFGVLVNFRKLLIGFRLREKRLDGLGITGEHLSSLKLLWDCVSARGCHSMPAESARWAGCHCSMARQRLPLFTGSSGHAVICFISKLWSGPTSDSPAGASLHAACGQVLETRAISGSVSWFREIRLVKVGIVKFSRAWATSVYSPGYTWHLT